MIKPAFANLTEAFLYCRDMDASLDERLEAFSAATRYLIPGYQEAVDLMVARLKAHDAGQAAPKPGEAMPPFAMPWMRSKLLRPAMAAARTGITSRISRWSIPTTSLVSQL